MSIPTIIRPTSGKRILVSPNVKPGSIRYLLRSRDRALPEKHQKIEPNGWSSLPLGRLRRLAEILASDRGACQVQFHHSTSQLCTASCQDARLDTVDECVCVCGGFAHGQGGGVPIPNTESLVRVNHETFCRVVWVRRGQTFHEALGAAFGRHRIEG